MRTGFLLFLLFLNTLLLSGQASNPSIPGGSTKRLLLNDPVEEGSVAFSPDGKSIYFSRHGASFNYGKENFGDIWSIQSRKRSSNWTFPVNLGVPVNSPNREWVVSMGLGGRFLYFQRESISSIPILLRSNRSGRRWSDPVAVEIPGIDDFREVRHYFVSPDEQILLICGVQKNTPNQSHIYISHKGLNQQWGPLQLVRFPFSINGDIRSVFLAADAKSLYFSTNGLSGEGGYDLFLTKRSEHSWQDWSIPQNLGKRINSPADEFCLTMPVSGELFAYISTIKNREGKVFTGTTPGAFKPDPILLLTGNVYPVSASPTAISFYSLSGDKAQLMRSLSPNPDGSYQVLLSQRNNIGFFAEREGYISESQYLKLTADLIEAEDYEAPIIAKTLQSNLPYQTREFQIRNFQLALNQLDSTLQKLKINQGQVHDRLNALAADPKLIGSILESTQLGLSRLEVQYNKERDSIIKIMESPEGLNSELLLLDTFQLGMLPEVFSNIPQFNSMSSFDTPSLSLNAIEDPFIDEQGYPASFDLFSQSIEEQLQQELLFPTIQEIEKALLPQKISVLKESLSENDGFAWDRFQKEIVEEVEKVLFSRQVQNLNSALSARRLVMQKWQTPLKKELKILLQPGVSDQIKRNTRDYIDQYIENLLLLKTTQERTANLEKSITKLIGLQRSIETSLLKQLAAAALAPRSYTDTITLLANFSLRQDIFLNATLVDTKTAFQNIFFAPNNAELTSAAIPDLERIKNLLLANPKFIAHIDVHTNTNCTYHFAQQLTEDRANSIKRYLLEKGIPESQINAQGFGKLHPLDISDSDQARKLNQRIELHFSYLENK